MPGFDALYKQKVTLFNRVKDSDGNTVWYITLLDNVHLIIDNSKSWDTYGGRKADNVRLHIRYNVDSDGAVVANKKYYTPKEWKRAGYPASGISFGYGDNDDFDFFVEGDVRDIEKTDTAIADIAVAGLAIAGNGSIEDSIEDDKYSRNGFYNYMNKTYDHVYAITSVSKYNLIPHFEIMAR